MNKSLPGSDRKTLYLILLMVIFGPLGNVLLAKGMRSIGALHSWSIEAAGHMLLEIAHSGYIWLGVASLITFFAVYMLVLSRADYSYVLPASSIAYGVVALLGHYLLGEVVTPLRWAGIAVICLGVYVVGHTPARTTELSHGD